MNKNENKKKIFDISLNSIMTILIVGLICVNIYQVYQNQHISKEYNRLKAVSKSTENETMTSKFNALLDIYDNYYYTNIENKEEYMDKVIEAFQEATGDKYATYINKEDMILEEREFTGEYYGVGITLTYPEDEDYILITEVQENSPAFEAGITEGTKLLELNNVKSRDEKCQEVFKEIASGKVDVVNLKTDKGEYNVKPRKLDLKTVKVKYEGDIAVIKIDNFTDKTDKEFLEIYEEIEKNPEIKGLLFDVRNNGGGDKAAVTEIVDRLAPKGLLYTEKYNSYSNEVMSDSKSTNLPIAILGNSRTASASELLIMTLQDTNDAVLVGETTYGKSTILIYVPFDDGSAVMLSTGFYYPPSDRYIEGVGIEPDIEDLENPYETAIEYLREKIDGGK